MWIKKLMYHASHSCIAVQRSKKCQPYSLYGSANFTEQNLPFSLLFEQNLPILLHLEQNLSLFLASSFKSYFSQTKRIQHLVLYARKCPFGNLCQFSPSHMPASSTMDCGRNLSMSKTAHCLYLHVHVLY